MSKATEAMNQLSGSGLTFAIWVVVSYGVIILLVNTTGELGMLFL